MNWEKWMMRRKTNRATRKVQKVKDPRRQESERMQKGTKGRKDEPAASHNANPLQSTAAKGGLIQYTLKKNGVFKGDL